MWTTRTPRIAKRAAQSIFQRRNGTTCRASHTDTTRTTTTTSWVQVHYPEEDEGRIAVLSMNRQPANALSLEFCDELSQAIKGLSETTTTTLVVESSVPNIFSAGLDIPKELYQPDADRLPEFWWKVQQVFLDLYTTPLTVVASLKGHAPAAGCSLALAADYRILEGSCGKIGFNESQLGIVAPPWMAQQYIDVLGHRRAELALLEGTLFGPQEALNLRLIDEWTQEPTRALSKAKEFASIPAGARAAVKKLTRTPLAESMDRQQDIDHFCNFVTAEPVQTAIGAYLRAMKKKP